MSVENDDEVLCLGVTRNGERVPSVGNGKVLLRVWDVETNQHKAEWGGHEKLAWCHHDTYDGPSVGHREQQFRSRAIQRSPGLCQLWTRRKLAFHGVQGPILGLRSIGEPWATLEWNFPCVAVVNALPHAYRWVWTYISGPWVNRRFPDGDA
ncbi:hypothetical protein PAXRUDRAFT_376956 [Paxillus rubicundulus Ve08.2h10]|uniref:Uncharacterized protein n=1 Tax=Paxillus rubicundulus Ve08.2h10 TaxID=930991 RepID=A0A0D0CQ53_9AGAM|nr:hypothetical protein PAXRUDRAFT_376956 [Paxillus rubicundulus Ve08.2h10]